MTIHPRFHSHLLCSLAATAREHPLDRKVLVASTFGEGRELLHALARARGGWMAFEVTTPGRLAAELAAPELAREGLEILDDFSRRALMDEVADDVLDEGSWGHLEELAGGVGFREALHGTLDALRLAGLTPERLEEVSWGDPLKRRFLATLLNRYVQRLQERRRVDGAEILARATELLRGGEASLEGTRFLLVPGLGLRGRTGRILEALLDRGARVLDADPVLDRAPPQGRVWAQGEPQGRLSWLHAPGDAPDGGGPRDLGLFSAASVADELREVLRRVMALGVPWDEVEVVATDAAAYGSALHDLSQRLGVPVSYAVGLPLERTRVGRTATAYLRWIEAGYPVDTIRVLLQAGDLRIPGERPLSPGALARRLRSLRIGWGRERWIRILGEARERAAAEPEPRDHEDPAQAVARAARRRREVEGLLRLMMPILRAAPDPGPDPRRETARTPPAELARGLRIFLERVPRGSGAERVALDRLGEILGRVEETLTRPMTFSGAMAVLRDHLKIRVPASRQDQPAPWEASGGHLHLSDLEHGGLTGRPVTFVVGLEARQGGEPLQDPLLLDRDRRALAPGELPTARDRLRWRRFRLEALLARLRGRVTLSYTAWDAPQARVLAPDSLVLQVHRLRTGRPEADYEALQHALGPPVTRLPEGRGELDASDVWLEGLSRDGRLLEGRALVHEGFPALGAGALAEAARADDRATAHDGLVEPRPERLDPRLNPELVLSAGRLEDLGTCPKRYFFRQVLGLRPPEDPEREPDRWLDPLERGRLLHRVFEETLRRARREGEAIDGPVLEGLALEVLEEQLQRFRREVPAPGEGVVMGEARSLRGDVRAFAEMVREEGAPWVRLELPFGLDGAPPGILNLSDGEVRLRGKVDRVDEVDGALRIVDYKTGSTWAFKKENRVFHGGRRLQHLVYSRVVEGLLDRPVGGAEYHFPTPRGRNERYRFSRGVLEDGPGLVENLLDAVARGRFLPTEEPRDCGLCDYRSICRVTETPWGSVESPPAEWALRSLDRLEEYAELRRARAWEER